MTSVLIYANGKFQSMPEYVHGDRKIELELRILTRYSFIDTVWYLSLKTQEMHSDWKENTAKRLDYYQFQV
jgi:hypothetical protein